jgi:hypothetical protein
MNRVASRTMSRDQRIVQTMFENRLLANGTLEFVQPELCAVVDGQDHDSILLDGIRGDKGCIRNDQLTGAGNPTSSARQGEGTKLLSAADDPADPEPVPWALRPCSDLDGTNSEKQIMSRRYQ